MITIYRPFNNFTRSSGPLFYNKDAAQDWIKDRVQSTPYGKDDIRNWVVDRVRVFESFTDFAQNATKIHI